MKPLLKKVAAAYLLKEGIERIQDMRRPKRPSLLVRAGRVAAVAGIGGAAYYLYSSGKFDDLLNQVKGKPSSDEYDHSASRAAVEERGAFDTSSH